MKKSAAVITSACARTRFVCIAGITTRPDDLLMAQVARNLTAMDDGFLHGVLYLILDLDSKFTAQFERILRGAGVTLRRDVGVTQETTQMIVNRKASVLLDEYDPRS